MNIFTQKSAASDEVNATVQPYTLDEIKANWYNSGWRPWHSEEYYADLAQGKRHTRDDNYLRSMILPAFPTDKHSLNMREILDNWSNAAWWQENIGNVHYILDNMYVKSSVKAYNGTYKNSFSRLIQYLNTFIAEIEIKNAFGFYMNEDSHSVIHTGIATAEDMKPDFNVKGNKTVELKLCEDEASIDYYLKQLNGYKQGTINGEYCWVELSEDDKMRQFNEVKQHQFHGADYAMFATKIRNRGDVSKLYTVELTGPGCGKLDDVQDIKLSLIPTLEGSIPMAHKEELPPVPYALLFGLTPPYQKKSKK